MAHTSNCDICNRYLDNPNDWLSADEGGTCEGCMNVVEGKAGGRQYDWHYYPCDYCNDDCVVSDWTLEYFHRYGQAIRMDDDGKIMHQCVEYWQNGGISTLIQNSTRRFLAPIYLG